MSSCNHDPAVSPHALLRLARRRARMKLGWYLHATVYVLVNLGLAALAALHGRHWAIYPAVFWGLGGWPFTVRPSGSAVPAAHCGRTW